MKTQLHLNLMNRINTINSVHLSKEIQIKHDYINELQDERHAQRMCLWDFFILPGETFHICWLRTFARAESTEDKLPVSIVLWNQSLFWF